MEIIRSATLADVIAAICVREYDYGKRVFPSGQKETFYALFYEKLDDGRSPRRVVVEGRAEFFSMLPDGIQWNLCRFTAKDLQRMFVINSQGWNKHEADFSLPERHDAIFSGRMDETINPKPRILEMLKHPEDTFAEEKYPTLIAFSLDGPWTVWEGNHTIIALYHYYAATEKLLRDTAYVGILPNGSTYPYLRSESIPLKTEGSKKHKTPEDVAQFHFPRFVMKAIGD